MENPHETFNPMWAMEESDYTVETLVNIAKTKTLRAAFSQYFPAFMYNQKDNQYAGIFFDVITKIATTHGWEIRWTEEVGYGVIVDGLCSNRFDIFASTVWPTPEREKDADFSVSLYESRVDVWCKEGSSLDTLSPSLRIAVREGDISDSIATDFLGARLVRVPQLSAPDALLQFVAEGRADITFVEQSLADRFNKDSTIKVSKASTVPIRTYGNTFMLRKGDDAFKHLLDTEIQKLLDDGFIKGLLQKYSSV